MRISLQRTLLNKNSLRLTALLIGFLLWSIISTNHLNTITVNVPLCFYTHHDTKQKINAPEMIQVTLQGKKSDLRAINFNQLAAHINEDDFKKNINGIRLSNKNLFLPDHVKLVNYSPMNLVVTT